MEVSRIRALRGPNLWSRNTAIEAVAACDGAECAIENLPHFAAQLRVRFPQLGELRPAGSQDPVSMAHVLAAVALALQAHAGCPVTFSRVQHTSEPGIFQVGHDVADGRRAHRQSR